MKTQIETANEEEGRAVVERMQTAYGVASLPELAARMDEPVSTVKNWYYRGSVKLVHLVRCAHETQRSVDWLVTGKAPTPNYGALAKGSGDVANVGPVRVVANENAPPWRAVVTHGPALLTPPVSGGPQGGKAGALLPVTGNGNVRPLVLSLAVEGAGTTLDYYVIPQAMGGVSAGKGSDTTAGPMTLDRAGEFAASREWMRRNFAHTVGDIVSIHVEGDSMAPTLWDGETIWIDCGVREVTVDGIYVFQMRGQRRVKRVQSKMDGSLLIISDNQNYEREPLPRGRIGEMVVLGRMVWPRAG